MYRLCDRGFRLSMSVDAGDSIQYTTKSVRQLKLDVEEVAGLYMRVPINSDQNRNFSLTPEVPMSRHADAWASDCMSWQTKEWLHEVAQAVANVLRDTFGKWRHVQQPHGVWCLSAHLANLNVECEEKYSWGWRFPSSKWGSDSSKNRQIGRDGDWFVGQKDRRSKKEGGMDLKG